MVPKELYLQTYARLKEKHAQTWVQSWPEKTDPRKFVFEDIGIASWLVALWSLECAAGDRKGNRAEHSKEAAGQEQKNCSDSFDGVDGVEEDKKQTFVDLGCGNGLLTHILNEEGHRGMGIDIVSRKVWSIYGTGTRLEGKPVQS